MDQCGEMKNPKPKLILCDIEGTTTSISFVKNVLFRYVRENLTMYLHSTWDTPETKNDLKELVQQYHLDRKNFDLPSNLDEIFYHDIENVERNRVIHDFVHYVNWQMDHDKKTKSLKQLQGHMWTKAYQLGEIIGHVYDDVPECFREWTSQGIKIGIYSSGSVLAQKLLFTYSRHGNLTPYISYYFDTEIGNKREILSYRNIIKKVNLSPFDILFLTDIVEEAQASVAASIRPIIVCREDNENLTPEEKIRFTWIKNFKDLVFTA